jgi:hypothetical protein
MVSQSGSHWLNFLSFSSAWHRAPQAAHRISQSACLVSPSKLAFENAILPVADEPRARSGSWDDAARLCAAGVDSAGPVSATNPVLRQGSSEESWDSAASDVSSGDESEQSTKAPSSRGSVSSK